MFERLAHPSLHAELRQHFDGLAEAFSSVRVIVENLIAEGGEVVETWAMQDRLGLFQQLGSRPVGRRPGALGRHEDGVAAPPACSRAIV